MATPPSISPPGSIHKLTHRVTTGQFWLRPDRDISELFLYLLAYCANLYRFEIHLATVLSNHVHLLVTDVDGDRLPLFHTHFFSLLSRAVNTHRKRRGNLLDPAGVNAVLVAPRLEDLVDHGFYTSMNAVEAGFVSHAKKWPGINFVPSEMGRRTITVKRPGFFFDLDGVMPEEVTLCLTTPRAVDASRDVVREQMMIEHNRREEAKRAALRRDGRSFLGRKAILRQSVRAAPKHQLPLFERVPHVACKNATLRVRMLQWRRERNRRYRELLTLVRAGVERVRFPIGTWFQHYRCGRAREPWDGCIWAMLMAET